MSEKNYKLIHDIQPAVKRCQEANSKLREAEEAKKRADHNFIAAVANLSGNKLEDLKQTNTACLAHGILHHIYLMKGPNGSGRNVCVFCGCDDFDL